jgi:hypothetical protein
MADPTAGDPGVGKSDPRGRPVGPARGGAGRGGRPGPQHLEGPHLDMRDALGKKVHARAAAAIRAGLSFIFSLSFSVLR